MYLPHSGLNNQRIALANALVLSKLLNRTLVIPPMFIGKAMPKQQFKYLYFTVKRVLREIKNHQLSHRTTDLLPWSTLFNLKEICKELDIRYIETIDYFDIPFGNVQYLLNQGNCKFTISDSDDLLSNPFTINATSCNNNILLLESLKNVTSSVLFMDSLFGTTKIATFKNENSKIFNKVHRHFQLNKSNLLYNASRNIALKMHQFIGIHYRVNDKQFQGNAEWLMGKIIGALNKYSKVWKGLLYSKNISLQELFYQKKWPVFNKSKNGLDTIDNIQVENRTQLLDNCILHSEAWMFQKSFKSPMILFIATDAPDPIDHPELKKLINMFPCTFFLQDFDVNLDSKADLLKNATLSRLMPIIDQYVVSMGSAFIGYGKSTFSQLSWLMYLQQNGCDDKMTEFNFDELVTNKALLEIKTQFMRIDSTVNMTEITQWLEHLPKSHKLGILWNILGCGFAKLM